MDYCLKCEEQLHKFMTTPIIEMPDGTYEQMCEKCADKEYPGWDECYSDWTNVSLEWPDEKQFILVTDGEKVYPAHFESEICPIFLHIKDDQEIKNITHWMYPPLPPER